MRQAGNRLIITADSNIWYDHLVCGCNYRMFCFGDGFDEATFDILRLSSSGFWGAKPNRQWCLWRGMSDIYRMFYTIAIAFRFIFIFWCSNIAGARSRSVRYLIFINYNDLFIYDASDKLYLFCLRIPQFQKCHVEHQFELINSYLLMEHPTPGSAKSVTIIPFMYNDDILTAFSKR